jgi:hypothetical protein
MTAEENPPILALNAKRFSELRAGFWDVIFHTEVDIFVKRGFATYYRLADHYVVENGGESTMKLFNDTCRDCGYTSLIKE